MSQVIAALNVGRISKAGTPRLTVVAFFTLLPMGATNHAAALGKKGAPGGPWCNVERGTHDTEIGGTDSYRGVTSSSTLEVSPGKTGKRTH